MRIWGCLQKAEVRKTLTGGTTSSEPEPGDGVEDGVEDGGGHAGHALPHSRRQ